MAGLSRRDRVVIGLANSRIGRAYLDYREARQKAGAARRPSQQERPMLAAMTPSLAKVQWGPYAVNYHEWYSLADSSTMGKAILNAINTRVVRNGFEWRQRYAALCLDCGNELAELPLDEQVDDSGPEARLKASATELPDDGEGQVAQGTEVGEEDAQVEAEPECPECGSTNLRKPNWAAVRSCNIFLRRVNENGMPLRSLVKSLKRDTDIADDTYLVRIKDYELTADGSIIIDDDGYPRHQIKEWVRGDPRRMRLISNDRGHLGGLLWVCIRCRDNGVQHAFLGPNVPIGGSLNQGADVKAYPPTPDGKCPTCKGKLYDAHYVSQGQLYGSTMTSAGPFDTFYIAGEVLHWHQYGPSVLYSSAPPMGAASLALSILDRMEYWLWEYYSHRRGPRQIIGIQKVGQNWIDATIAFLGLQAKRDPETTPWLSLPEGSDFRLLELDKVPKELQFVESRHAIATEAGMVWQVSPAFTGETQGAALSSSSEIQVTITEDVIHEGQNPYNEEVFPKLIDEDLSRIHPGIVDFELRLRPSREEDFERKIAERASAIAEAKEMRAMGFDIELEEQEDTLRFRYHGKAKPQPEFGLDAMLGAAAMGDGDPNDPFAKKPKSGAEQADEADET